MLGVFSVTISTTRTTTTKTRTRLKVKKQQQQQQRQHNNNKNNNNNKYYFYNNKNNKNNKNEPDRSQTNQQTANNRNPNAQKQSKRESPPKNHYFRSPDLSNSIFSLPGPLKTNIFIPRTSKSHDFGGFWSLKWTQVDTKITSRNNIMLKQPGGKKYSFFK